MPVSVSGSIGYGHEQTVIQSLSTALKGEHLQLVEQRCPNTGNPAPEAAILFYRAAARLDVNDILRQVKTIAGGKL